jgi:hypothetical protein
VRVWEEEVGMASSRQIMQEKVGVGGGDGGGVEEAGEARDFDFLDSLSASVFFIHKVFASS